MITDVLTLIAPSPQFMATSYLASTTPGENPTITYLSDASDDSVQDLVYMKGLQGYPWDWTTVTQSWIRQRLTERVWSDPTTGKLCFGLGVRRFPRYIVRGSGLDAYRFQWTMQSPETDYLIFDQGGAISRNTDAGVRCTFTGPYAGQATGTLPAGEDWIATYEWGGKLVNGVMLYAVLESLSHRVGFGRYEWQSYTAVAGVYPQTPTAQSLQNVITPLPAGPIVPVQKVF